MAGCSTKHLLLKDITQKQLLDIRNKKIFVIGVGGLGCAILPYIARFYPKEITLIDFDKIELSNIERQILFDIKDVGLKKVDVAQSKLKSLCKITTFDCHIEDIDKTPKLKNAFNNANLIVDCTDDICTKQTIFDLCQINKKILVTGSVVGTKGYVYSANFEQINQKHIKTLKHILNKKPDTANISGVLNLAVNMVGTIIGILCIKSMIGYNCHNKVYNVDSWHIDLKTLRL